MNEMVERVACAIENAGNMQSGEVANDDSRARSLLLARVAIGAMHAPTENMYRVGAKAYGGDVTIGLAFAWTAMIDAALED